MNPLDTPGPYTLHIAAVLWIVVIAMLIRERRKDARAQQKAHMNALREYAEQDVKLTQSLYTRKK